MAPVKVSSSQSGWLAPIERRTPVITSTIVAVVATGTSSAGSRKPLSDG